MTTDSIPRSGPILTNAATPSPAHGDTAKTAPAGAYDIVLVADRQAGSLYRFFRDWRFESRCAADPRAALLFTVPVGQQAMVSSGTRYLMEYIGERAAATDGGTAAFAWSVAFAGASDPLAEGLAQAQRQLAHACPAPDTLRPSQRAGEPA